MFESAVGALKSVLKGKGPGLELEIANSVWCNQACAPRSEYLAKVKKDHDGEVIVLDFGNPETVDQMNGWVSGKTRGKINSIVESLDPLGILVAINAVYFKDLWVKPFGASRKRPGGACFRSVMGLQNENFVFGILFSQTILEVRQLSECFTEIIQGFADRSV